LPKTDHGNRFLLVITDRFSKLTRTVPLRTITALVVELGIEKLFTTVYHPQTNGQVECYNRTIVNALHGYVSKRQNAWDEFTYSITFGYNCRIHSSLGLAPFELVLSRPPRSLSVEHLQSGTEESHETVKLRFLKRLRELKALSQRTLTDSQERYKRNYDKSVRDKN
jgi:hypothetical protein